MPSRSILVRVALLAMMLAGLVALADGVVQQEFRQATNEMAMAFAVANAEPAGASDE